MSEGVEWALHSCLNLSWAPKGRGVPAKKLAGLYGLPTAYLNKQLQALARAGILTSTSGPKGGFKLARPLEEISLLDVLVAIEGAEDPFRCDQILRHGPGGDPDVDYRQHCVIAQAMSRADLAWRRELAAQNLAEIRKTVQGRYPDAPDETHDALL